MCMADTGAQKVTSMTAAAQIQRGKDNKPVSQDMLSELQVMTAPTLLPCVRRGRRGQFQLAFPER